MHFTGLYIAYRRAVMPCCLWFSLFFIIYVLYIILFALEKQFVRGCRFSQWCKSGLKSWIQPVAGGLFWWHAHVYRGFSVAQIGRASVSRLTLAHRWVVTPLFGHSWNMLHQRHPGTSCALVIALASELVYCRVRGRNNRTDFAHLGRQVATMGWKVVFDNSEWGKSHESNLKS